MKKLKLLVISLVALSVFIGWTEIGITTSGGQPEGQPFKTIWEAITNLRNDVATLKERVLNLENWKTVIATWKTEIDSWKTVIEEWRSWVDKKLMAIQKEIADLGNQVSNLETPAILLEKIKQVDGQGSGLDADLLDGYDSSQFLSVPWSRLTDFPSDCPSGQYVYGIGGTLKCSGPTAGIGGSGTDNYIPKWKGTSSLENSVIYQNDSGNVGIGTTGPKGKLDVVGGLSIGSYAGVNTPPSNGMIISGKVGIGTTNPAQGKLWVQDGDIWIYGNQRLAFTTDGSTDSTPNVSIRASGNNTYFTNWSGSSYVDRMVILGSEGNVGIGTTTPVSRVSIYGFDAVREPYAATLALGRRPDGGPVSLGFWYNRITGWHQDVDSGGNMNFHTYTGGTWPMRVTFRSDGNVGIGTTSPTEKLHVDGNVKAKQYLTGDIIFQKDEENLWRMFEKEDGLYVENLKTGKAYKFLLEEVVGE